MAVTLLPQPDSAHHANGLAAGLNRERDVLHRAHAMTFASERDGEMIKRD